MLQLSPFRLASLATVAALGSVLAVATACSWFKDTPQFPCPQVGVPRDASTLTRFRPGPGRDLTDVIFDARVQDVKIACEYTSKGASIDLAVVLGADRGPADQEHIATIPYFIAVTDAQKNVLAKQVFTKTLTFPPNTSRVADADQTEELIPLPVGKSAERYGIVVGVQLTPEELDYNRTKNRR
jgi:hypothetical protein